MPNVIECTLRLPWDHDKTFVLKGSASDESIPRTIRLNAGYYEPEVMLAIRGVLTDNSICVDVGANLGAITVALASLVPRGFVYAFEPIPENFQFLEENLRYNAVLNAEAINCGLYSSEAQLDFHYVEQFGGGAFFTSTGVRDPRERIHSVHCTTLDAFVAARRLPRLDFAKIDVEGGECDVIMGGRQTLATFRPRLCVEFNPAAPEKFRGRSARELFEMLVKFGYSIQYISRTNGLVYRCDRYDEVLTVIEAQGGVADVICVPRT